MTTWKALLSCLSILLRRSKLMMLIKLPVRLSLPVTMTFVLPGLKDGSHLWNAWRRRESNFILVLTSPVRITKPITNYNMNASNKDPPHPPSDTSWGNRKGHQHYHGSTASNGKIKNGTRAVRPNPPSTARKAQNWFILAPHWKQSMICNRNGCDLLTILLAMFTDRECNERYRQASV